MQVLTDIKFGQAETIEWMGAKLKVATAPIQLTFEPVVGVDPGRNFGCTFMSSSWVKTVWGTLPKQEEMWRYGSWAIEFCNRFAWSMIGFRAIIEGAAYRAGYGQVGLAEVRFGFAYGMEQVGGKSEIVAPMKIRKAVLGNGRGPVPYEYWPTLNTNAVDSLIAALYAMDQQGE